MNDSPRKSGTEKEIPMNNAHRLDHILDSAEAGHGGDLATEVTQVGALAAAWALHVLETAEVETIDVGRAL